MNFFTKENFTARRTTGNNMHDPDSLLTGQEIADGFTYNDPRQYASEEDYLNIVEGRVPVSEIPKIAPRVKNPFGYKVVLPTIGKSDAVAIRFKTMADAEVKREYLDKLFAAAGFPARWTVVPANYVFVRRLLAWVHPSKVQAGDDVSPSIYAWNPVIDAPVSR